MDRNVRLIYLKAGDIGGIPKLAIYNHLPEFVSNLEKFRKDNDLQYDLIFSNYWLSGWSGKLLQRSWGVPHIMMFHTLGAVKNTLGIGKDEPELRIGTERELARNCHRIITATKMEKEQLGAYYGASLEIISIIPCGINLDLFRPVNRDVARKRFGLLGHNVILFVGRIEPIKGIDLLLKAITYLRDKLRLKLLIVGGDVDSQEEMGRLQMLSQDLQLQDLVTFTGLVKQEQLRYFYSAADVCVIPSHSESFGLVALESLACGTPVVANQVGGMEDIIQQGETGYVVKSNDPCRLADKIFLLLSRPSGQGESTKSLRMSVTRFSWSRIAGMVTEECRNVIADYRNQTS
jgi:D-inositol-3-phosphate glycosyltransferase